MAAKDKKDKKGSREQENAVPEGFIPVSTMAGGAWFKPESGAVIWGELLGRFKRRKSLNTDKEAHFFQIMIEKPCVAVKKIDDETVEVDCQPGDIVNVDERSALEDLASLVDTGKRWRVYIKPLEKVPIPGTAQTVWRFIVGKQEITEKNAPKVKPRGTEDDISFP